MGAAHQPRRVMHCHSHDVASQCVTALNVTIMYACMYATDYVLMSHLSIAANGVERMSSAEAGVEEGPPDRAQVAIGRYLVYNM